MKIHFLITECSSQKDYHFQWSFDSTNKEHGRNDLCEAIDGSTDAIWQCAHIGFIGMHLRVQGFAIRLRGTIIGRGGEWFSYYINFASILCDPFKFINICIWRGINILYYVFKGVCINICIWRSRLKKLATPFL